MYYLYLDESEVKGASQFLTVGGIIVDDEKRTDFIAEYNRIIPTYFNFPLPKNFKLHYEELRNIEKKKEDSVYKKVAQLKMKLTSNVFCVIKDIDYNLLSVTINMEKHFNQYLCPKDILGCFISFA